MKLKSISGEITFTLKKDLAHFKAGENFTIEVNNFKYEQAETKEENIKQMVLSSVWGTITEIITSFEEYIEIL